MNSKLSKCTSAFGKKLGRGLIFLLCNRYMPFVYLFKEQGLEVSPPPPFIRYYISVKHLNSMTTAIVTIDYFEQRQGKRVVKKWSLLPLQLIIFL